MLSCGQNSANNEANATQTKESSSSVNKDYVELKPQFPCDKPVVIEFFAYHCPHCYRLSNEVAEWQKNKPEHVEFRSIATNLGDDNFNGFLIVHQAAQTLGVLDKAKQKLFERLHKEQKLIASEEDALNILISVGVDKDEGLKTLQDIKTIEKNIISDLKTMQAYKIVNVPTFLVNHRYKTGPDTIHKAQPSPVLDAEIEVMPTVSRLLDLDSECTKNNIEN